MFANKLHLRQIAVERLPAPLRALKRRDVTSWHGIHACDSAFLPGVWRYPSRIEDLENTNNFRSLRKRYTDPLNVDRATGKERDFKLLRQTDVSLNNGTVLAQTQGQTSLQSGLQGPGGF